jgi:hypothetical protein
MRYSRQETITDLIDMEAGFFAGYYELKDDPYGVLSSYHSYLSLSEQHEIKQESSFSDWKDATKEERRALYTNVVQRYYNGLPTEDVEDAHRNLCDGRYEEESA